MPAEKGGSCIPCACCAYDELLSPDRPSLRAPARGFTLYECECLGKGEGNIRASIEPGRAFSRSDSQSTGSVGSPSQKRTHPPQPNTEGHASMQAQGSAAHGVRSPRYPVPSRTVPTRAPPCSPK